MNPSLNVESLKRDLRREESAVRVSKAKMSISGEYEDENRSKIEFWRKKNGKIEVRWSGFVDVETKDYETCNLGHRHTVIKSKKWEFDYNTIGPEDVEKIIEWLTG